MKFAVLPAKVTEYLLKDPAKRKFFQSFGYTAETWPRLQQDILQLAAQYEASMRIREQTKYGKEYEIIGDIITPAGRKITLKTAWYLDVGETGTLRFITAYPA